MIHYQYFIKLCVLCGLCEKQTYEGDVSNRFLRKG